MEDRQLDINSNPTDESEDGGRYAAPVVNNAGGVSETPSVLVAKGDDKHLSPNPYGFGFTSQTFVDSLPESAQEDVLYVKRIYNNGVLIGYTKYKWTREKKWEQLGATPDLSLRNGVREQKAIVANAPKTAPEKVFTGDVVFNKEPFVSGLPLSEYLDKRGGGVTHSELEIAIAAVLAVTPRTIETTNITALTTEQIEGLKIGDRVVKKTGNQNHLYTVSYKEHHVGICLTYIDASTVETVSYDYTEGSWVYNSTDVSHLTSE